MTYFYAFLLYFRVLKLHFDIVFIAGIVIDLVTVLTAILQKIPRAIALIACLFVDCQSDVLRVF